MILSLKRKAQIAVCAFQNYHLSQEDKMNTSLLYAQKIVGETKRGESLPVVETDTVRVGPDMAGKWLAEYNYEFQRPVRSDHVEYLAEEMRRGFFRQGTQIHFVRNDGKLYLVNGQHTLSAIRKSGFPQVLSVCYTEESPAEAYYRHDVHLKRSAVDMFGALQLGDELGFTKTQLNQVSAAVVFMNRGFKGNSTGGIHPDDRLRLIREYADAANHYYEIISGKPQDIDAASTRMATLSIAIATLHYAIPTYTAQKVEDFWKGVVLDDGIAANDPRKAANKHLRTVTVFGNTSRASIKASAQQSASYIAECWNAWVENRKFPRTKPIADGGSIFILGTPWKGNSR
jgi:hypothetical protein